MVTGGYLLLGQGLRGSALFRMTRPLNAALAAVGVLAGMALAVPHAGDPFAAVPLQARLGAPLAALLITAFGNVVNDLRDIAIDRTAHPTRPLPSGRVSRAAAFRLASALVSMGLASALLAGAATFLFALGTVALLVLYELRLKRAGLAGNATVALLTAATFVFGATAAGHPLAHLPWVAAVMAFFVNLGREVAKDIQDLAADLGHRTTLPMQLGAVPAGIVVLVAAASGVAFSLPFFPDPGCLGARSGILLAATLGAADAAVLSGGLLAGSRPVWGQRLLKAGMAMALVAFLLAAFSTCAP